MKYPDPIPEQHIEDDLELSVLDSQNPHSLVRMVPEQFAKKVRELPVKFWTADEKQLAQWAKPTEVEAQLRISFWNEYQRAVDQKQSMKMGNVYAPVCTKDYFYRVICRVPSKLGYVLAPPQSYSIQMEEMLNLGLGKMREVLMLPVRDNKGNPNTRLIAEWVKIVALLDNRVKGAVTQNFSIRQQSLNVNVNKAASEAPRSVEDIDAEMRKLDREIKQLSNPEKQKLVKELNEPAEDEQGEAEILEGTATPVEEEGAGA